MDFKWNKERLDLICGVASRKGNKILCLFKVQNFLFGSSRKGELAAQEPIKEV